MKLEVILKKLITFQTVSKNHAENAACLRWIRSLLRGFPLYFYSETVQSFPALLITTQKTKNPFLWLVAHVDVVPGSSSVFSPKQKKDALVGRGAFDMKFAAACYVKLFQDLTEKLPRYNFGVMLTSDEELGGKNGVQYFLSRRYRSKVAFVPDGGTNWEMERGAKGILEIEVQSKGFSAHASRPWLGKNAIMLLAKFLLKVQRMFPEELCHDKKHWHPTCNVGVFEGGNVANQIPDFAKAELNMRFPSEKQKEGVLRKIQDLQKKFPHIHVRILHNEPGFKNDGELSYENLFVAIAKKHGVKTGHVLSHGTSDARFFVQRKVPVVATRPNGGGHHGEHEWIHRRDLERFYQVVKEFVMQVSKNPE